MTAAAIARALGFRQSTDKKPPGSNFLVRCVCHDDKSPSLSIADGKDGRLLVHCFANCEPLDILAELRRRGLLDDDREYDRHHDRPARRPRPVPPQAIDDSWRSIWRETVELSRSPAEAYLLNRLGRLPGDLADLRFHPRCPRGRDRLPALVALMRAAENSPKLESNRPTGIHRTFLARCPDDSWGKANVEPVKMMLGTAAGSVIKLSADEDVTLGLGICEGVEDGIAILNGEWAPVWCCMSASNMAAFPILNGVEALTVFCDADSPGLKAAHAVVERWRAAGKEAEIAPPPDGTKDFAEAANG